MKTGLGKTTIKRIQKRGTIKYKNDYSSPIGRPRKVTSYQKKKIKGFIQKNERNTLDSTKAKLKLDGSKQTLSLGVDKSHTQENELWKTF